MEREAQAREESCRFVCVHACVCLPVFLHSSSAFLLAGLGVCVLSHGYCIVCIHIVLLSRLFHNGNFVIMQDASLALCDNV